MKQPSVLIIAGSRNVPVQDADRLVSQAMQHFGLHPGKIIEGGARGIDRSGFGYAVTNRIQHEEHPADWKRHGKAAGPIRNRKMAEVADALLLIWDGKSRGSANMLKEAEARDLTIYQYRFNESYVPTLAMSPIDRSKASLSHRMCPPGFSTDGEMRRQK